MLINIKGTEIPCPTSAGAGTSFTEATVVRLVNTAAAGTNYLVTVQETAGGTTLGTVTLAAGEVAYISKKGDDTLTGAATSLAVSVAYAN